MNQHANMQRLVILVAVSITVSAIIPLFRLLDTPALDFKSYYIAGHLAIEGNNIYLPDQQLRIATEQNLGSHFYPYIYFPMIAVMIMPLAMIPFQTAQWIWTILSLLAWFTGLAILTGLLHRKIVHFDPQVQQWKTATQWVLTVSILAGISESIALGQINTFSFLLLTLFLAATDENHPAAAGFCLGVLCLIKPQPALLIPYLFLVHRARTAWVAVTVALTGTATTASVIGWNYFKYYLKEVMPTFSMIETSFPPIMIQSPPNRSIYGAIARLGLDSPWTTAWFHNSVLVLVGIRLSVLFILTATFVILYRYRRSARQFPIFWMDCGWIILVSNLVAPLTWNHHMILLVAFMAPLFIYIRRHDTPMMQWIIGIAWVVIALPVFPMASFWHRSIHHQTGLYLQTAAMLVIWGIYGFILRRRLSDMSSS